MSISAAFALPHPPVILPEVGHGREKEIQKTIDAYNECAKRIAGLKPDTIVLTSPHSTAYADYFHISPGKEAHGDLRRFQASGVSIMVQYDEALVKEIEKSASSYGVSAGTSGEREPELDHGTIIPLAFVNKYYSGYRLVRIGLSGLSAQEHYRLGVCISRSAEKLGSRVVFIASGDLSHRVTHDGPYGYAEEGVRFDKELTQAFADGDFLKLMSFSGEFAEKAAECGLRSFIIMAGALDKKNVTARLLSYEGTFGVGYGVASFIPGGDDESRNFLDIYNEAEQRRLDEIRRNESEYVRLARYSLEHFIRTGEMANLPENLSGGLTKRKAGAFVSLKKHGRLRGCIGTIMPATPCLAEEILRNAVSAAEEDPRFNPVEESELDELVYSVDVLSSPETVSGTDELDVKRYGVIVTSGRKRGLLLPDLDGVDTVSEQIRIAKQKAGITEGERFSLERFEVVRYK